MGGAPGQHGRTNSTTNATNVNVVYGGQVVTLDPTQNPAQNASTTDPDGTTSFTYTWSQRTTFNGGTQCSSGCIFAGGAGSTTTAQPVITIPAGSTALAIFLRLTVTDQFGTSATAINFQINRAAVSQALPTVTASGPALKLTGETVNLTGTATDPQTSATPPQVLSYNWVQVDGSNNPVPNGDPLKVTLTGGTTLTPSFTAPANVA